MQLAREERLIFFMKNLTVKLYNPSKALLRSSLDLIQ
jgi:hypothetical protein